MSRITAPDQTTPPDQSAMLVHRGASDSFADAAVARIEAAPGPLAEVRQQAIDRFTGVGLPTTRDEDWRFTNLRSVAETSFAPAPPEPAPLDPADVAAAAIPGLDADRLVFVDGVYQPALSILPGHPGVTVELLRETERPEPLAELLQADARGDAPFTLLATALATEAAVLTVEPGASVSKPIELLHLYRSADRPMMTHTRRRIVVGEGAELVLLERHVALAGGDAPRDAPALHNTVVDLAVGRDARVEAYFITDLGPRDHLVRTARSIQQAGARLKAHVSTFGGKLTRNQTLPVLAGEKAWCLVNGVYLGEGEEVHDNFMRIEHREPQCDSRQFFHGVLGGRSHAVFSGRIFVDQKAQLTDAKQHNANLLLSDDARANSKPQLEIYADDVKCTHGATIGQIDEQAMFYLRARGVPREAARGMMVFAFAAESLQRMSLPAVASHLRGRMLDRLPHGEFLRDILSDQAVIHEGPAA